MVKVCGALACLSNLFTYTYVGRLVVPFHFAFPEVDIKTSEDSFLYFILFSLLFERCL